MARRASSGSIRPLDRAALDRLALRYVERYATTRRKLADYLKRKCAERGWQDEGAAPIDAIVMRFAELGYVDDAAFAQARAASLQRRGYGARRIGQALSAAGIGEQERAAAQSTVADGAWDSAIRFAQRKRIGPFSQRQVDRPARERALAAMLRAGHRFDHARKIVDSPPGTVPDADDYT